MGSMGKTTAGVCGGGAPAPIKNKCYYTLLAKLQIVQVSQTPVSVVQYNLRQYFYVSFIVRFVLRVRQ